MNRLLHIYLILTVFCLTGNYTLGKSSIDITYIANEGYLFASRDKKILIDALFQTRMNYLSPDKDIIEKMIQGQKPFGHIDIYLTTHSHFDHFNPELVARFLKENSVTKMISSFQTMEFLKQTPEYQEIRGQLLEFSPDFYCSDDTTINDINIKILRLRHGGDSAGRIQNLGFVFELDGIKVLHTGDNPGIEDIKEYQTFKLNKQNIDIAFINWSLESLQIKLIKEYLAPKHIVIIHTPSSEIFNLIERVGNIHDKDLPKITIFKGSMEKRRFKRTDGEIVIDTLNIVPIVKNPINTICTLLNQPINFKIPENTFYFQVNKHLSYSASLTNYENLPPWLTFDPISKTFKGLPQNEQTITIRLTAIEDDGDKACDEFILVVTDIYPAVQENYSMKNGLLYSYYEGDWNNLPDFNLLTPVKTGTVQRLDITSSGRDDYFGFQFQGYINIQTEGLYCFYLRSDDGSKLFIGEKLIIENDGLHDNRLEQRRYIGLKAGKHPFKVIYFEKGGEQNLEVGYEGPGMQKEIIPTEALFYKSE